MKEVCLHCSKRYVSLSGLKKHIRSIHGQTYTEYKKHFKIITFPKNKVNLAKITYEFLKRIENGQSVKYTDLKREDRKLLYQIEKSSFKNINNLCDMLGFSEIEKEKMNIKTNGELMSKEEILSHLQHLKSVGRLTTIAIRNYFEDTRLQSAINSKFGNVENCLNFFNLERDQPNWDQDKIKEKIVEYHRQGVCLSYSNMILHDSKLVHSAKNHFDFSWSELIESLGIEDARKRRNLSKKNIANMLNKLKVNGIFISPMNIKLHDESLSASIYYTFGGFEELYTYMGLDPNIYMSSGNLQSLGIKFEKVVRETFEVLEVEHLYNKPFLNVRPDFQFEDGVWADAKLSSWTAFYDGTFDKYLPHCKKLIIVYFRGDNIKNVPDQVQLIHISSLIKQLDTKNKNKIMKKLSKIEEELKELHNCS